MFDGLFIASALATLMFLFFAYHCGVFYRPRERTCAELGHSWRVEWVRITWRQRPTHPDGKKSKPWELRSARGRTICCRRCATAPLSHEAFELAILRANAGKLPEADWPNIELDRSDADAERIASIEIIEGRRGELIASPAE